MAALLALRSSCLVQLRSSYKTRSGSGLSGVSSDWRKSSQAQKISFLRKNHHSLKVTKDFSRGVRAAFRDPDGKDDSSSVSAASNDLQYLGKFFAACTAGAALVKYGSVIVPSITQPNLLQALIMISTPVLVSIVVLQAASSEQIRDE
ncbi:hypothetical protein R1flu_006537 [Riccia fluitans]|uniref:Uncharacterized protein n=1 Tax=Riccia fluitans TaxID=41844 RepID=A0ABD1YW99_9MARC